ncbi:MAG: methyltransferase domain-containing protein [bacterium]|nr:methyltransferase domain-containing protein [bacterium]
MKTKKDRIAKRRQNFRIPCSLPLQLFLKNQTYPAETINFSLAGLAIKTLETFSQQNTYKLVIKLPFGLQELTLGAHAIFSHSIMDKKQNLENIYGLRFLKITHAQQKILTEFLDKIYLDEEILFDRRSKSKKEKFINYHIHNSLTIKKNAQTVFSLLTNTERYQHFMTQVDEIKSIDDHLAWKIFINDTQIKWQEKRTINPELLTIKYQQIAGELRGYQGEIKLAPLNNSSTTVNIISNFQIPASNPEITTLYQKNIKRSLRLFLQAIKRELEAKNKGLVKQIIVSRDLHYKNRSGKNIRGYHDFMKGTKLDAPFVIVIPGYGETKRDALTIAYYFAVNGFNVLRYDATNHLGESDGEILNFTLTNLKNDLLSSIDYLNKKFKHQNCAVVATSLSARIAIKAASHDKRINFLGLLVPVVNLQATLKAVYGEDLIQYTLHHLEKKEYDIFGFIIDSMFLRNSISRKLDRLNTSLEDANSIKCPTCIIAADNDSWNQNKEIYNFFSKVNTQNKFFFTLSDSLHQLFENPEKAKEAIHYLVYQTKKEILQIAEKTIQPNLKQLTTQNRKEKHKLASHNLITVESEKKFWNDYMVDFKVITKAKEYRDYLTDITNLLGNYKKNQKILDAGCGIGHYGAWLFISYLNLFQKLDSKKFQKISPIHYYGLDFTKSNIEAAESRHRNLQENFYDNFKDNINCLKFSYIQHDLNQPLPYKNNTFDKVVSSLVLSYLHNPLFAAKELLRILKNSGILIISSLKPYSDLSRIYCEFLKEAKSEHELKEVRSLLSSAGKIKRKAGEGHYKFFTELELKNMLISAGAKDIQVFRSFGNQANLAVGVKRR